MQIDLSNNVQQRARAWHSFGLEKFTRFTGYGMACGGRVFS
jgi:hypothetical protein